MLGQKVKMGQELFPLYFSYFQAEIAHQPMLNSNSNSNRVTWLHIVNMWSCCQKKGKRSGPDVRSAGVRRTDELLHSFRMRSSTHSRFFLFPAFF
jgi:hypothetical protein